TQIIPGSYEGFLESFDENDYFEVYVSASNVIKVNMTPSSGSNFDLALYDPDEDLIEESTLSGSAMESISYTVETSGDHFILVNYISGSSTYELEIEIEDNVPPTLSITSPTNGSEVKSSTVEVTWTGSDADTGIDHYEVKLDGGSWINVSTATSYNFTEVSDGSHTVYVKAVDGAENAKEAMVNFTVSTGIFGLDLATIAIIAIIIIVVVIIIIFFFLRRGAPPTSTPPPSPPPVTPPT
ncbi:MAG: Ig-like domain-containing protein, partial [Candidatus Methylarchaceae archaeon HK02M2]|nr:Ig-like domain-containing protein [Candidatus Methylarchaceae archaeon HK02M2]